VEVIVLYLLQQEDVAGLEIPMQDGHEGLLVQVEHAARDLHRPVDQHVREDAARADWVWWMRLRGPARG
jgi:hypothetical protein